MEQEELYSSCKSFEWDANILPYTENIFFTQSKR